LVSAIVELVPTRGQLPAHFKLFVVACPNSTCHVALGTSIVNTTPPAADKGGFHGASVAEPQRIRQRSVGQKLQRLLGDGRASRRARKPR
jgi:hypothetical protein